MPSLKVSCGLKNNSFYEYRALQSKYFANCILKRISQLWGCNAWRWKQRLHSSFSELKDRFTTQTQLQCGWTCCVSENRQNERETSADRWLQPLWSHFHLSLLTAAQRAVVTVGMALPCYYACMRSLHCI